MTLAEFTDIGKAITAWVSPLLVLIGWFILNVQANRRETRKEIRQQVDRAVKLIESAAELGMKVHSTPLPMEFCGEDAKSTQATAEAYSKIRQLKFALAQLSPLIQSLRERNVTLSDTTDAYIDLREALTGGDFETSEQKPWPPNDPSWVALNASCVRLSANLEQAYQMRFKQLKKPPA